MKHRCKICGRDTRRGSKESLCYSCIANKRWAKLGECEKQSERMTKMWSRHPEIRKRFRIRFGGENNPMSGKKREDLAEYNRRHRRFGKDNPMFGKQHTEKTCKKMAAAHSAYLEKHSGPNHPMFGRRHTEVSRKKMSEHNAMKNRPEVRAKVSGPNASNWLGGISFEPYSTDWKGSLIRLVLERDGHRCQICSGRENERKLSVHHIDYNKKNCSPNNLITLCNSANDCHNVTNHNRSYWPDFFKWLKGQKEADIAQGVQGGW